MAQFRKKPVVVEAVQFSMESLDDLKKLREFTNNDDVDFNYIGNKFLYIETLEGNMRAEEGDWIIRGVNGELYPCKPDIFEKTYELVNN